MALPHYYSPKMMSQKNISKRIILNRIDELDVNNSEDLKDLEEIYQHIKELLKTKHRKEKLEKLSNI